MRLTFADLHNPGREMEGNKEPWCNLILAYERLVLEMMLWFIFPGGLHVFLETRRICVVGSRVTPGSVILSIHCITTPGAFIFLPLSNLSSSLVGQDCLTAL